MKHLLIVAASVLALAGCATNDNHGGSPGQDRYREGDNHRSTDKASDNMRDAGGWHSAPTTPFTSPNGSSSF